MASLTPLSDSSPTHLEYAWFGALAFPVMSDEATMRIETSRLELHSCDLADLDQLVEDRAGFARRMQVEIPEDFPVFPEGLDWWRGRLRNGEEANGWAIWIVIRKADRVLIGDCGFKGAPNEQHEVEIGYALIEHARGAGMGKELARGLVDWAFAHDELIAVRAETLVDGHASMGVLRSLGMQQVGKYVDPDEGEIVQWRVDRDGYFAQPR